MSLKTGDIILLKSPVVCQGGNITITYGFEGRIPVLVLPFEEECLLAQEVRDAIAVLRKRNT